MPDYSVRVSRWSPDAMPGATASAPASPRFESHQLQLAPQASVLDALFAIQRTASPELAFRFSCRVGMCGSCAMVVNGRETLTCSTLINQFGPNVTVQPLRNLPVVRDLAVDMAPFFDAYQQTIPYFEPRHELTVSNDFYPIPRGSREWRALDHQPQCIDCGACYSSCTVVNANRNYLGPMALHRALNLIVDPRDNNRAPRMLAVENEAGAFRCHTLGNCKQVCPKHISPTKSIERLKRLAVTWQLRRFFTRLLGGRSSA